MEALWIALALAVAVAGPAAVILVFIAHSRLGRALERIRALEAKLGAVQAGASPPFVAPAPPAEIRAEIR
jgi:hypothetical protein